MKDNVCVGVEDVDHDPRICLSGILNMRVRVPPACIQIVTIPICCWSGHLNPVRSQLRDPLVIRYVRGLVAPASTFLFRKIKMGRRQPLVNNPGLNKIS